MRGHEALSSGWVPADRGPEPECTKPGIMNRYNSETQNAVPHTKPPYQSSNTVAGPRSFNGRLTGTGGRSNRTYANSLPLSGGGGGGPASRTQVRRPPMLTGYHPNTPTTSGTWALADEKNQLRDLWYPTPHLGTGTVLSHPCNQPA